MNPRLEAKSKQVYGRNAVKTDKRRRKKEGKIGGVGSWWRSWRWPAWGDGLLPAQMELSCGVRDLTAKAALQEGREEEKKREGRRKKERKR